MMFFSNLTFDIIGVNSSKKSILTFDTLPRFSVKTSKQHNLTVDILRFLGVKMSKTLFLTHKKPAIWVSKTGVKKGVYIYPFFDNHVLTSKPIANLTGVN